MTRRVAGTALACVAAALVIAGAQAPTPARVTITRHFTAEDQKTGRYQYVPFDVPRGGTAQLRVSYQYDRANGDTVVDLGLIEPGPLDLGRASFRGYSGGARSEVVLANRGTTPGYRPGPPQPGQWHALLGLYKVAKSGVDVTLTIETTPGPMIIADYLFTAPPVPPPSARWYTGALHTHTLHSDGTVSPSDLLRMFAEKGFDFVAITDHNNTTHGFDPAFGRPDRPLWIVGEEVTTPGGHANVWGLRPGSFIDFRVQPGDVRIRDLVAAARKEGGVFSINHPASECVACGWTHEVVDGIEGMEISNGRHGEVEKSIAMWEKLLLSGRRITAVGSSDWHSAPNPIDNANVRVYAPVLTQDAILAAIRAGRVIVMTNATDATPDVVVRAGDKTAGVGESLTVAPGASVGVEVHAPPAAGGRLAVVVNGARQAVVAFDAQGRARSAVEATSGYVRVEIARADGSPLAYTNPVYLVRP